MATLYTTTVEVRGGGRTAEDAEQALRSVLGEADRHVRREGDTVLIDVDVNAADTSEAEPRALEVVEEALGRVGMPAASFRALDTRTAS